MPFLLANATNFDPSILILIFVLQVAGGIAVACALAGPVIFLARKLRHRHVDLITTATLFWGMLAIGSIIYAAAAQMNWSRQYGQNLMSGNYDPSDVAPPWPWSLWGILVGVYLVILLFAAWKKRCGHYRLFRRCFFAQQSAV